MAVIPPDSDYGTIMKEDCTQPDNKDQEISRAFINTVTKGGKRGLSGADYEKVQSFLDDIKFICESYDYKWEYTYDRMEDMAAMQAYIDFRLKVKAPIES